MIDSRETFIKARLRDVSRDFAHALRGRKVILFGSRVAGGARPRSDFDIGITGASPLAALLFAEIEDAVESIETLYKIDIVDLASANRSLRESALKHYEVIYE